MWARSLVLAQWRRPGLSFGPWPVAAPALLPCGRETRPLPALECNRIGRFEKVARGWFASCPKPNYNRPINPDFSDAEWGKTIERHISHGVSETANSKGANLFPRSQVVLGNVHVCEVALRLVAGLSPRGAKGSTTSKTIAFPSTTWERGNTREQSNEHVSRVVILRLRSFLAPLRMTDKWNRGKNEVMLDRLSRMATHS